MEVLYTYKGHQYAPWEDYEDHETVKRYHEVIDPKGNKTYMDFSCYDRVTERDFKMWIDLGKPKRLNPSFPLTSQDLEKVYNINTLRFTRE